MADAKPTNRQIKDLRHKNMQKASALLVRLHKNAEGELYNQNREPVEMTAGQIKSAEIFLRKTLPDLQSVDSTVTMVDERTGDEMMDEAMSFLMKAGMSEDQAREAIQKMAKEASH